MKIRPIQIPGKGWDVTLPDGGMLCNGRAPYTLAQAQVAAATARILLNASESTRLNHRRRQNEY